LCSELGLANPVVSGKLIFEEDYYWNAHKWNKYFVPDFGNPYGLSEFSLNTKWDNGPIFLNVKFRPDFSILPNINQRQIFLPHFMEPSKSFIEDLFLSHKLNEMSWVHVGIFKNKPVSLGVFLSHMHYSPSNYFKGLVLKRSLKNPDSILSLSLGTESDEEFVSLDEKIFRRAKKYFGPYLSSQVLLETNVGKMKIRNALSYAKKKVGEETSTTLTCYNAFVFKELMFNIDQLGFGFLWNGNEVSFQSTEVGFKPYHLDVWIQKELSSFLLHVQYTRGRNYRLIDTHFVNETVLGLRGSSLTVGLKKGFAENMNLSFEIDRMSLEYKTEVMLLGKFEIEVM
jgi:hypothetical protein